MKFKRYHKTLKEARNYIESLPNHLEVRVWPIKKSKMGNKYWMGSELEWLNRY